MTRIVCRSILSLAILLCGGSHAPHLFADVTMRAENASAPDKFPIRFSYYPALADKNPNGVSEAGVVVLLHGDKGSRINWDKGSAPAGQKTFPAILQESGYAVITVDLRKHGQSVMEGKEEPLNNDDYAKMATGDLKAIKDFILTEHQAKKLNMGKLAVIGAGFSAPVAAAFSQFDWEQAPYDDSTVAATRTPRGQDVKAIVLLSPDSTAGRISTNRSLVYLTKQNVAILVMVGKGDGLDKGAAKNAFKAAGGGNKKNEERVYLLEPDIKDRGTNLFGKYPQFIESPVLKFLELHIKNINVPWVDRRSRLERN